MSSLDLEKAGNNDKDVVLEDKIPVVDMAEVEAPTGSAFQVWLRKISHMGVELRGIERVMPEDRQPKGIINNLLMWWSVNCVLTTVPIGTLGPTAFGMGLSTTILCIIGFTILGCFTTAFCAILGPKLGLRQMVISRFSFGWWGAVVLSLLNIITQVCKSCKTSGQRKPSKNEGDRQEAHASHSSFLFFIVV